MVTPVRGGLEDWQPLEVIPMDGLLYEPAGPNTGPSSISGWSAPLPLVIRISTEICNVLSPVLMHKVLSLSALVML